MGSVLVCVRTTVAAQVVATCAMRLGFGDVFRTAVGRADALARIADAPADVVLADTVAVRPDPVGFTRMARERSPDAVVVFFGPEDPAVARTAVVAGARGLIRGGEHEDLVTSVAKALMLLVRPSRTAVPLQRSELEGAGESGDGAADPAAAPSAAAAAAITGATGGAAAPDAAISAAATDAGGGAATTGMAVAGAETAGLNGMRPNALTERELQVLLGMADGKSNAEIGRELFVSEDTVKTHARRLFRKLGARDRAHAVAAAFRAGIVR